MIVPKIVRRLALAVLACSAPATLLAQNPDLALSPAQRDSVLAGYDNIFPILGRQAIERGFDLPKPLGINVIGLWVKQGIDIENIALSTGDDEPVPVEGIEFGDNTSEILTGSLRADLWVLPFLNVYGLAGRATANTTVRLVAPLPFTSSVDQTGNYAGIGLTGAFGVSKFFAAVDVNWSWTELEKLDVPVRGRVLSLRLGRTFKVSPTNRLQVWAGAMNVKFATETNGSISLDEVIPPETVEGIRDRLENIEEGEWYQGLDPLQQAAVDRIVDALLTGDQRDVIVNYQLDKAPSTPWNMLLGANLDVGKHWSFRSEVGLIGRYSVLLNAVYRLDL